MFERRWLNSLLRVFPLQLAGGGAASRQNQLLGSRRAPVPVESQSTTKGLSSPASWGIFDFVAVPCVRPVAHLASTSPAKPHRARCAVAGIGRLAEPLSKSGYGEYLEGPARGRPVTKVAVITGDPVGPRMAGPAIRAWNMARVLGASGAGHEVRLISTTRMDAVDAAFGRELVEPGDDRGFGAVEGWADLIVFQGHAMSQFPGLRESKKVVVADVYDPMHLEMLEQARELGRGTWELQVSGATAVLNEQLGSPTSSSWPRSASVRSSSGNSPPSADSHRPPTRTTPT